MLHALVFLADYVPATVRARVSVPCCADYQMAGVGAARKELLIVRVGPTAVFLV